MAGDESSCSAFVDLLKHPEALGVELVAGPTKGTKGKQEEQKQDPSCEILRRTCQALFQRVENLARLYHTRAADAQAANKDNEHGKEFSSLSGLDELYMDPGSEIVYGQVEVQNTALQRLLNNARKSLSKAAQQSGPTSVRLLGDDDEGTESDSYDEEEAINSAEDEVDIEKGRSSEASFDMVDDEQRMRKRMERVMQDMEEDEEDDPDQKTQQRAEEDKSSMEDPAADELNDGFFDIHEMEAFADEEEEYLPDEAYGEERPETTAMVVEDKRSFHQKLRDGDLGSDDESKDNDAEEDSLLFRATTIRRKRYRSNDEVQALFRLYEKPMDPTDDENDDVIHMTAADIFGKPKKKHFDKWHCRSKDNNISNNKTAAETLRPKGEDDSWEEYDFRNGVVAGWNDKPNDAENNKADFGSDEEANADEGEEPAEEDDRKPAAATDRKQEKARKQIESIETEMISEKPWQMRGEVPATARPLDSLLDSTPEFEVASKQAPIITVEHTADLEEVIKKRILDEDWDDVVPRELPDVAWNQRKGGELPEVSQEKSKLGLGELYEREYLKKVSGYDAEAAEKETEEEKAKTEMKTLFANLCSKLDALSNYHFAPRPVADEAEVRGVSKPAIAMEEVLPLRVSDARAVAPEEVYGSKRGREGVLKGETELEQDRKRLRSAKKTARRKSRKEKLADEKLLSRLEPGLGLNNPYEKRKMRQELASARARGKVAAGEEDANNAYGKSTTFFKRMQNKAQNTIQAKVRGDPETAKQNKMERYKSSALRL